MSIPSTNAQAAFGAFLQMSDVVGTSFTTVAEVKDINLNISTKSEVSTSHSSGVAWETVKATINTFGPVEFAVNYLPAGATHNSTTGLVYVQINRQERNWRLVDPDGAPLLQWTAIITAFKGGYPVAGLKNASITLTGSGAPSWT